VILVTSTSVSNASAYYTRMYSLFTSQKMLVTRDYNILDISITYSVSLSEAR